MNVTQLLYVAGTSRITCRLVQGVWHGFYDVLTAIAARKKKRDMEDVYMGTVDVSASTVALL